MKFCLPGPESDVADRVKVRAAEVDFEAGGGATHLHMCFGPENCYVQNVLNVLNVQVLLRPMWLLRILRFLARSQAELVSH